MGSFFLWNVFVIYSLIFRRWFVTPIFTVHYTCNVKVNSTSNLELNSKALTNRRTIIIPAEDDWIFILVNFYYCYQVYNNRRRYRRRPAMTDGQLTANIRRWLFGVYSSPAAADIFVYTTPNWVKLLPIYEHDIGHAAGSLYSRPSSPLSAMNAYKSSTTRKQFLTG